MQMLFCSVFPKKQILSSTSFPQEGEAELSMVACSPLISTEDNYTLIIDIGGGSSELSLLDGSKHVDSVSIPYGVLNLTDKFYDDTPESGFRSMLAAIDEYLTPFDKKNQISDIIINNDVRIILSNNAQKLLVANYQGLSEEQNTELLDIATDQETLLQANEDLVKLNSQQRVQHIVTQHATSDFSIAGYALISSILKQFPSHHITMTDRGILHGLLEEHARDNVSAKSDSIENIRERFEQNASFFREQYYNTTLDITSLDQAEKLLKESYDTVF